MIQNSDGPGLVDSRLVYLFKWSQRTYLIYYVSLDQKNTGVYPGLRGYFTV